MEEEGKKKKETVKKVNIGARTGMIAPVVSLGATSIIIIHAYLQDYPLGWWLIILFASLAGFLLVGSLLQTVVEIIVERIIEKEEEEKRLREVVINTTGEMPPLPEEEGEAVAAGAE